MGNELEPGLGGEQAGGGIREFGLEIEVGGQVEALTTPEHLKRALASPSFWIKTAGATGATIAAFKIAKWVGSREQKPLTEEDDRRFTDFKELAGGTFDLLTDKTAEGRVVDPRRFYRYAIHPLKRVGGIISNFRDDQEQIASETDVNLFEVERALARAEYNLDEFPAHLRREARKYLKAQGYEVLPVPVGRTKDWEAVLSIMEREWRHPKLREERHGLGKRPPQEFLVVKRKKVVQGYISFMVVEDLTDEELLQLTLSGIRGKQIKIEKPRRDVRGKTIVLASGTNGSADPNVTAAMFFGIDDYMGINGAKRIGAPVLSPFISINQQREYIRGKPIGSYKYWWNRRDADGFPTDQQRQLFEYFGYETIGVVDNYDIIKEIKRSEVLTMLAREKNIDRLTDEQVIRLLSSDVLFLRDSHVPLEKVGGGAWRAAIPAAIMVKENDLSQNREDIGPYLYREFRLPIIEGL